MENLNLIETFSEFKELKNIDRVTMMSVLEDVFRGMLLKKYGTDENFDIIINIDKGDFEIWRNREVVEDNEVEDAAVQITLTKAKEIDEDYEVGEEVHAAMGLPEPTGPSPVDLRGHLVSRAIRAGVGEAQVTQSSWCTLCQGSPFFSHRRGDSGRQVGFLGILSTKRGPRVGEVRDR